MTRKGSMQQRLVGSSARVARCTSPIVFQNNRLRLLPPKSSLSTWWASRADMADMFARVDQPVPGRDPTAFDKETLGEKNEVYAFMSARRN